MSAAEPHSLTGAIKNLWPAAVGIGVGLLAVEGLELGGSLSLLALVITAVDVIIGVNILALP